MRRQDIERVAKRICRDYCQSEEAKAHWHGHGPVASWDELSEIIRSNFRFMARWHLEEVKQARKIARSGRKKSCSTDY